MIAEVKSGNFIDDRIVKVILIVIFTSGSIYLNIQIF